MTLAGHRTAERLVLLVASVGLAGLRRVPPAPGTIGTVAGGVPAFLLLALLPPALAALGGLLVVLLAIWIAGRAERILGLHDPGVITIDEVAGFLVAMAGVPARARYLVAGVLLFRLFDIVKPFPANRIDRALPGGFGTVLDDCVAGLYGWLALWALRRVGF